MASAATTAGRAPSGHRFFALGPGHLGQVALWAAVFLVLCYIPLRVTDLWGHVGYGRFILEHRALPAADPFMPLAEGMPVVDTLWLSQVVFAAVERGAGAEGLALLFGLSVLAAYLLLARAFFLQGGGRRWLAAGGVALAVAVGWCRFATIRPENLAAVCLAALLWLATARRVDEPAARPGVALWVATPVLFALWANLHGSFAAGLALLGALAAGRAAETAWRARSLAAAAGDPVARRWLVLAELGLLGSLANPYGIDLLIHSARFGANPNLADIIEWQPLAAGGACWAGFALAALVFMAVLRVSRRPLSWGHALALLGFAAMTAGAHRMITWLAPVFVWVVMPHLAGLADRYLPRRERAAAAAGGRGLFAAPSWRLTLVAALVVWIAVSLSPLGTLVLGGTPRPPERLFESLTPVALTEWLVANPPDGLAFSPQWWGDWLALEGPPGFAPMVTSHIHMVPPRVWRDYMQAAATPEGWREVLPAYGIDTAIWDKNRMARQIRQMHAAPGWTLAYEDRQAAVFVRRPPADAGPVDATPPETAG